MTNRDLSSSTIEDFLDGVEEQTRGESRTEYVFDVGGTRLVPDTGAPAGTLPDRTEIVVVKMLADRELYDAI